MDYKEIDLKELKSVCKSANESGLLGEKIRYVAVSGVVLYDNFITAVENVPDEIKGDLPDDVIDFFNMAITDPDPDPEQEWEEPELKPELTSTPTEEPEPEPKPELTSVVETESNTEHTTKKRLRKSKVTMTVTVADDCLIVEFKSLKKEKEFKLPPKEDKEKLSVLRKIAMEFATKCGATSGQRAAVSKALNSAGYYMQKREK